MTLCLTPELAAEVTLQPVKRFGMDGAILFSDILIVPYGLGQALEFLEGHGPQLEKLDQKMSDVKSTEEKKAEQAGVAQWSDYKTTTKN